MSGRMKAIGSMVEFGTIKPRECGGEKAEVEMVFNGQLIAALGVERTDFVLDFFESAFDFPSCGIKFDHLFVCQFKVGCDQRECEVAIIDEYDSDFAFQSAGDAEKFGKTDFALLPVKMYHGAFRLIFKLDGNFLDTWKSFAVFGFASTLRRCFFREVEQDAGNAQAGKKFNLLRKMFANFVQKRHRSKPAVADNQNRAVENSPQANYQSCSDSGFGFEPFFIGQLGGGFDFLKQRQIDFLSKRQTGPTSVNELQNADDNTAVPGYKLGGVRFCSVIEMSCPSENVFSGIAVSRVVKRDQKPSGNPWIAKHANDKSPKRVPWNFFRVKEIVESFESALPGDNIGEFTENTADSTRLSSGGQGNHDGSENDLPISRNNRGCLIEQIKKFHGGSLSFVESVYNIAQTILGMSFLHVDNQRLTNEI